MDFNREKLKKLNKRENIEELKRAVREEDRDLKAYIENFVNKEENQAFKEKVYDLIVCTIGFSPYTSFLSLGLVKANKKIILVHTRESLEKYDQLHREFIGKLYKNKDIEIETIILEDGSDTAEGFSKISQDLKKYEKKKIAIDITGGKKPTVAIGFLAGAILDKNQVDIIYLDFKEYELRGPVYGSEFMTKLLNPVDLFSQVDKSALEEMYKSENFKGARILAEKIRDNLKANKALLEHYSVDSQLEEVEKIHYFCKLYENRFNFNYKDMEINKEYLSQEEIRGIKFLKAFQNQTVKLDNKNRDKKIYDIYCKRPEEIIYPALDRYLSALKSSNLDLQNYTIRLTSVIELAGIVATKGGQSVGQGQVRLIDKINAYNNLIFKYKDDLHKLRKDRNDLAIVHGSLSLSENRKDYEKAVLEYLKISFIGHDIEKIIEEDLEYRPFEKII